MTITVGEAAVELGVTPRQVSAMATQAGLAPVHYVREGGRMVAIYDDDLPSRLRRSGGFGRVAAELGVTPDRLAEVILKHLPGGALAVPPLYRTNVR